MAEFVGGPIMIVLLVLLLRRAMTPARLAEARAQAERGIAGRMEGHAAMDMTLISVAATTNSPPIGGTDCRRRLTEPTPSPWDSRGAIACPIRSRPPRAESGWGADHAAERTGSKGGPPAHVRMPGLVLSSPHSMRAQLPRVMTGNVLDLGAAGRAGGGHRPVTEM